MKTKLGLALTALLILGGCAGSPEDPYFKIVQNYADTLIEHGRDTYGRVNTPLFADCLDQRTLKLFPESEIKRLWRIRLDDWDNWRVRNSERCFRGANPHQHQDLFQVLYALSEITGENRYANEADKALKYYLQNTQSKQTYLYPWGEHMCWDFRKDDIVNEGATHDTTHEFRRPWVLWDRCYRLARLNCRRFARGLWDHQIGDQSTGNFSRHAGYLEHKPELNSEYPRHGGFYIATWGEAYKQTRDPIFLKATETLVTYFDKRRSPQSGAVPAESVVRSGGRMLWALSNVSLAISVWDASESMPPDLKNEMRAFSRKSDSVFLRLKHDLSPGGPGYLIHGHCDTLEPRGGSGPWVGYSEFWNEAAIANNLYLRYQQDQNRGYLDLVLKTAERYLYREPAPGEIIHPETIGSVILLMVTAHELSSEQKYLDRADFFARKAIELFIDDALPLPKATPKYAHYEAVTGADTMMMALLKLWIAKHKPDADVSLVYSRR